MLILQILYNNISADITMSIVSECRICISNIVKRSGDTIGIILMGRIEWKLSSGTCSISVSGSESNFCLHGISPKIFLSEYKKKLHVLVISKKLEHLCLQTYLNVYQNILFPPTNKIA